MPTRAERFRSDAERSGAKRRPRPTRKLPKDAPDDVAAERRGAKPGTTATRNVSRHAARKAQVGLEDSTSGRPSRKSTRSSKNRALPSTQLQKRKVAKVRSADQRARKAAAKAQRGKKTPAR